MTRPTRNRLLVVLLVIGIIAVSRVLPDSVMYVSSALFVPIVALSLWITLPFQRARTLLARRQFDDAALELAHFEKSLSDAPWKRLFAALAVGLYTNDPVAAARNTLGAVRLEQGQLDDAAKHFDVSLEKDPGYAVPWANRAVLAATRGDEAGAKEAMQRAKALGFSSKLLPRVVADKLAEKPS